LPRPCRCEYRQKLAANLILNAGWSWLFFKYQKLGASAIGAAVLAASSADLARRTAAADPRAGPRWCRIRCGVPLPP